MLTAGTLLIGYGGYYICRSNLSVAAPLLLDEFGGRGLDKPMLGIVASLGVLAYAIGKLVTGVAGDFIGGRRMFLVGMVGSVLATVGFGASAGLTAFALFWVTNRFVQSMGWGALVKIAAHWFQPAQYGRVMAILSLSFLFGDAAGRFLLGALVNRGLGWRGVFFSAAASLSVIAAATVWLLRDSPRDRRLPEPEVSPRNLYGDDGDESTPRGLGDLLRPYAASPSFWLVCLVSCGLTLIRETFNGWTPTYLVEVYRMSDGQAAQTSSLFPFVGGISVLVAGRLSDRIPSARLAVAVPFLTLGAFALAALGSDVASTSRLMGLALLSAIAFLVIGPYSLLAGAIAVDLGGRRGSATAAGLIDTAGYVGGVLSGYAVGSLAATHGWGAVFQVLAAVAALSTVAALLSWRHDRRAVRHDARVVA